MSHAKSSGPPWPALLAKQAADVRASEHQGSPAEVSDAGGVVQTLQSGGVDFRTLTDLHAKFHAGVGHE
jgi:hypothetical protein